MNAPQNLDELDDVDLAALSTRVLHDMVAKMTPDERQRYRDALDAADAAGAALRDLLGAALGVLDPSSTAPGKKCATCRGAFSGMSWDTLCPSCWEANLRKDSAARRARVGSDTRKPDFARAEQVMQDYVADYEMHGEDSLEQDACHIPTERERVLFVDAIHGLLAEPEFIAALVAPDRLQEEV